MPDPKDWRVGDVIQIVTPDFPKRFDGCLLVVTERHGCSFKGYIQLPGQERAPLWITLNDGVRIGKIQNEKEPADAQ